VQFDVDGILRIALLQATPAGFGASAGDLADGACNSTTPSSYRMKYVDICVFTCTSSTANDAANTAYIPQHRC
jgi:hypothetical protein